MVEVVQGRYIENIHTREGKSLQQIDTPELIQK